MQSYLYECSPILEQQVMKKIIQPLCRRNIKTQIHCIHNFSHNTRFLNSYNNRKRKKYTIKTDRRLKCRWMLHNFCNLGALSVYTYKPCSPLSQAIHFLIFYSNMHWDGVYVTHTRFHYMYFAFFDFMLRIILWWQWILHRIISYKYWEKVCVCLFC